LVDEVQSSGWAVACGLAWSSMRSQMRGQTAGGRSTTKKVAEWFENFREKFR
jgi:hypothetical protein